MYFMMVEGHGAKRGLVDAVGYPRLKRKGTSGEERAMSENILSGDQTAKYARAPPNPPNIKDKKRNKELRRR